MRLLRTALLVVVTLLGGLAPLAQPVLGQGSSEPGSLRALLGLLPLIPLGGETQAMVTYANLARQAEAVGIDPPESGQDLPAADDWVHAVGTLAGHSRTSFMTSPAWFDVFGFDLFNLDQVIEYSAPPTSVSVLRGRFDPDGLISHWEAAGYVARESAAGTYYAVAGDYEIDFDSAAVSMVLASANYLAILDPETIIFAPAENLIIATMELAAGSGTGKSLADEINLVSMLEGVPDDLVSGTILSGTALIAVADPAAVFLTGTPDPSDLDGMATRIAAPVAAAAGMPPLTAVLLGSSAGGPVGSLETSSLAPADMPTAKAIAVVVTVNDGAARTVGKVIDTRLRDDGGPLAWSEFFAAWSVQVVEEEPVVRVELELAPDRPPGILLQMLFNRELGFLAWSP